jgi:hypothetical protein
MPTRRVLVGFLAVSLLSWTALAAAPVRASHSTTAILPDLSMLAPTDFRIVTRDSGRKLLRFSTIAVNLGPGPFQLYGFDADGPGGSGAIAIRQEILESDGSFSRHRTSASMFWGGDGHNHFHVLGGQKWTLKNLQARAIGRGAKTGFCFLDSYRWVSQAAPRYTGATNVCLLASGRIEMGISPGWGDIYRYDVRYQWVDITGLPNGEYKLKVVIDPPLASGGQFIEADDSNNRAWAKLRISGSSVVVLSKSRPPSTSAATLRGGAAARPTAWWVNDGPPLVCPIGGREPSIARASGRRA